jgi:hypothetical protein
MEFGFEAAKGTLEQLLSARSPVVMRVLLPGALAAGVLYPSVSWLLGRFSLDPEHSWQAIVGFAILVVALGELIALFSDEIYKIYEGRILWPPSLIDWAVRHQEARLKELRQEAERAQAAGDSNRYDETWYQLRSYPMNDRSEPEVQRPTLLGNILAGYEQYPYDRYGMDSVFYWPRIWLQIEKEKKEEIDNQWCVADGLLTLSAISLVGGAFWIVESAVHIIFAFALPFNSSRWAALAGVACWVAGYAFYRLSLPHHRANGELFKSIFDLYRAKVQGLTKLRPNEKQSWDAAWAYLQYLRVVCPNCGKMNPVSNEDCFICRYNLRPIVRRIRDSGELHAVP